MIQILASTDERYAAYCGIMLTSVFENTPSAEAYIMVDKPLSAKQRFHFSKLEKKYSTSIHFIVVDSSSLKDVPTLSWTLPAYFRILAPSLLPASIDKILYLDCDIIVNGDLTPLWETPLTGKSVAAVIESGSHNPACNYFGRLGYEEKYGYFNSGVLLMNLEYWRTNGIQKKALDYIENHKDIIRFPDQDVLNCVLKGTNVYLHSTYNFQSYFVEKKTYAFLEERTKNEMEEAEPVIAHIMRKPWNIRTYPYPFYKLWHRYKRLSPWKYKPDKLFSPPSVRTLVRRYIIWPYMGLPYNDIFYPEFYKHPEWK